MMLRRLMLAYRDIGSVEPGKVADLIVLDANPLDDIRNSRTVRYVMKQGQRFDAMTLDQLWPRARPFRSHP